MKLKHYVFNIYETKCDCCGSESTWRCDWTIRVKNYSERTVKIPGFYVPRIICENPNCEWSKVNTD